MIGTGKEIDSGMLLVVNGAARDALAGDPKADYAHVAGQALETALRDPSGVGVRLMCASLKAAIDGVEITDIDDFIAGVITSAGLSAPGS